MPTWYDKAKSDELLAAKAASSHTHTSSQVTDLPETVRDTIATALVAGTNVTITPNDAGDTITIDAVGGGSTDPEVVRDTIASALVAGANVTITPDDTANTITIAAAGQSAAQTINAQTGTSYTLVAGDAGKVVTLSNTGAITLNAPGSVFTAGQRVDVVVLNTGMATVAGTSGATVNGTPSLVSRARYSAFTILWLSATSAVVVGDLA